MKKAFYVTLTAKAVAYTAMCTAVVTVATLLGFSSAQFYFNLGDSMILASAALFGPFVGLIAGGIGSFLADLIVYPATMFFTLIIKGLEGLIAGSLFFLIRKKITALKPSVILSVVSMTFSALFMALGYFICQTFFYGTYASAIIALPMDVLQAVVSVILASLLLYPLKLLSFREKIAFSLRKNTAKDPESNDTVTKTKEDNK